MKEDEPARWAYTQTAFEEELQGGLKLDVWIPRDLKLLRARYWKSLIVEEPSRPIKSCRATDDNDDVWGINASPLVSKALYNPLRQSVTPHLIN